MNEILLGTMLTLPLALAAITLLGRTSAILPRLAAWTAVPGLLLAFCRPFTVDVSWLLLDSRLGLDHVGRVFLAVTAVLWLAAGWYAGSYLARDARRGRFQFFFLLTMTGNLGVTVAQDAVSFLAFFTLMSLAAYGLIVHDRRPASFRAGQVYLVMTVSGEMLLFAGLVLLFHETGSLSFDGLPARLAASPRCGIVVGLLLAGFGIKLGVMPLHVWLPLAHPAAPTPASAVLSGAIIKTGLLGCLRMLPLGAGALPGWSDVCVGVGLATCVLAALIGVTQRNPKAVLAYSSVSQMGLVTVCLGAALAAPGTWSTVSSALLLWMVHHALTKAALFFGVGVAGAKMPSEAVRHMIAAGLVLAALALAGLPGTMGFAAKIALKYSTADLEAWRAALAWLLPLTSLTTTLLVSRFLWLVWPGRHAGHHELTVGMAVPWAMLSLTGIASFFVLRWQVMVTPAWVSLELYGLWTGIWPILIGGALVGSAIWWAGRTSTRAWISIPEGDMLVPIIIAMFWLRRRWFRIAAVRLPQSLQVLAQTWNKRAVPEFSRWMRQISGALENDMAAGLLLVLLAVAIMLLALG
jgi:formate hydrogenlyase subunit 3/multisubunit Na+/H+ antiporter MnhD subunit